MICTFEATLSLSIERMTILVTGGAGFIGSHLVRHLVKRYPDYTLINLDALTYAADLSRLDDVNNAPNYQFVEGNINDSSLLDSLFSTHHIEAVIHLAAESHVDRSIVGTNAFWQNQCRWHDEPAQCLSYTLEKRKQPSVLSHQHR